MPLCRFIITPRSPWSTPMRSDTLNGLVLCRIAEDEGDAAVSQAIDAFREGRPPFALSSAFPEGFLPMPKLPPMTHETFLAWHETDPASKSSGMPFINALKSYKKFRKLKHIPLSVWQECRGALSHRSLFSIWLRAPDAFSPSPQAQLREPHVSVDRRTGTAAEGALFFREARCFARNERLHLYADADDPGLLLKRLERIGLLGFGKDASSGRGRFGIEADKTFSPFSGTGSHALLLSRYSAPAMAALDGWYAVEVKRGFSGAGTGKAVFKAPFLSIAEGAVIRGLPGTPAVLEGLHADPRIVQILTPVTLPCTPEVTNG